MSWRIVVIYSRAKLDLNAVAAGAICKNVRQHAPGAGVVQMLTVTEKQYNEIEYVVGENMYIKTMNIRTQIKSYLDDLVFDGDYNLDYDDDFELKKLFSVVNLRFSEEYEDALGKLVIFNKDFDIIMTYCWKLRRCGVRLHLFNSF